MRHALRILLLALALGLIGLALTPKATPAQGTSPCDPNRPIPYWSHLRPAQPCAGDSVTLVFGACGPCVEILGFNWGDSSQPLRLDLRMRDVCLVDACVPDTLEVPLGVFAAGYHQLNYLVRAGVVFGDSGFCYVERPDSLRFQVGCPVPPPPEILPGTEWVHIGPPPPCIDCPPRICPATPIPLSFGGVWHGCFDVEKVELLAMPYAGPLPTPPLVRFTVRYFGCAATCIIPVPWSVDTVLPGLPAGTYQLPMEMVLKGKDCRPGHEDSTLTYYASQAFTVQDSCLAPPYQPCLLADWDRSKGIGACDAVVGPDRPAQVGMTLATHVPLAGLQGRLSFTPPGLRIARLVPSGQAAGMHIAWEPRGDGADFMMFAEQGAPIVPVRCDSNVRCVPPPVLTVVLATNEGVPPPPVTHLVVHDLLGSDSLGNAVPECPIMTLVVVEARICAGPSCDFNQDGRLDVRDLVSMVRCVLGSGPCPDTSLARLDCNADGRLGVDDVMCCARVILRGGERDTVPGRPEPSVAVRIGEPEWATGGLQVPVRLLNADRVGAARLVLALPLDRYEVTGVELAAAHPDWLALNEVVDGQLVLGLVGLGPADPVEVAQAVELMVRLALKPGQTAGGEIGLADAQLSGPDGVTLEIAASPAPVPLPAPGALLLSEARPNPFARETRFALNLDHAADVDLAVHDLSGRRIATLFHGALAAGPHAFTWRGLRGDGSTAANGIYFLQARVGPERFARKVILLRGN